MSYETVVFRSRRLDAFVAREKKKTAPPRAVHERNAKRARPSSSTRAFVFVFVVWVPPGPRRNTHSSSFFPASADFIQPLASKSSKTRIAFTGSTLNAWRTSERFGVAPSALSRISRSLMAR